MKAAKKKAGYLLESVNEELGSVISVIELDENILFGGLKIFLATQ